MPVQVGGSKVADPRPARVLDLSPAAVVGDKARASAKKNHRRRHKKASSSPADAAASSISPMQRLFDTSREVFANSYPGFVPPPDAVARLSGILSTYPVLLLYSTSRPAFTFPCLSFSSVQTAKLPSLCVPCDLMFFSF